MPSTIQRIPSVLSSFLAAILLAAGLSAAVHADGPTTVTYTYDEAGRLVESSGRSAWPAAALHTLSNLALVWFRLLSGLNSPY